MFFIQPDINEVHNSLEAWDWLDLGDKQPFAVTAFGDVFLRDSDGIWFLDTIEGSVKRVAADQEELEKLLNTEEGHSHYLAADLVTQAHEDEFLIEGSECYTFEVPPVLGGKLDLDNVVVMEFATALSIAGQVHLKVKDMPPGTEISEFEIET